METKVFLGKLVAKYEDIEQYITYVFEILDDNKNNFDSKYCMCVQYPNWNGVTINIGNTGFVKVNFVEAGVDQWFDGVNFNKYRYDDIIFYKFIEKQDNQTNELFL